MPRKKKDKGPAILGGGKSNRPGKVLANFNYETGDGTKDGRLWLSRIGKTRTLRQQRRNGEKDWMRYRRWYEGEQWMERGLVTGDLASDNARQTATVNITGSIAGSYIPFLISGDIKFHLKARRPSEVVSAELQQHLLNYEWTERKMTSQIKKVVQDVVVIGHGIAKTGYILELDTARAPKEDGEIVYADYIKQDAPFIERVDPLNFYFDLSARDSTLHTARWCAELHFVPVEDVLSNSKYNREALNQIHAGTHLLQTRLGFEGMGGRDGIGSSSFSQQIPEEHLAVLIEIWDKKYKKRLIYADGVPIPLLEEAWPFDYLDNFPYVKIDYVTLVGEPYGMGVMRQAEDQQMQLNRIRTAQFHHIRSHGRKFLVKAGALEETELAKFTDGPDGTIVTAEESDSIKPIADAAMSGDFQIVEARIASDIQQLTGADALFQGQPLQSRTTAGEVSTRTNILRLKAEDRVANVEEGVIDLATQVLGHLKAHRTIPDVVRVTGPQGVFWKEYTSEEIQAQVDLEVEYFAAPKFDPAVDRQQRLSILQIAGQMMPLLQQSGSTEQLNVVELLGWVLEAFDAPDRGRFFKPSLALHPPLTEGEPVQSPALAGASAPAPIAEQPVLPPTPGEGQSPQDILAGLLSNSGGLPQ